MNTYTQIMENGNSIHPDFLRTLSDRQTAWLAANGIEATAGERFGFYFSKGDCWIEPVRATAFEVDVMIVDNHEDGDGARLVESYPRLRTALRILAAIPAHLLTAD